jgi:DNA oxidative demethylase
MTYGSAPPPYALGTSRRTGEARHEWEHSIAEMEVTRWSITFRSLSKSS